MPAIRMSIVKGWTEPSAVVDITVVFCRKPSTDVEMK